MATPTVTVTANNASKPPILLSDSPVGISTFIRHARTYFTLKKDNIKTDCEKILILGGGLVNFSELDNWFASNEEELIAKTYEEFIGELQRKALPRDYIWDAKRKIKETKQGDRDFNEWMEEMRTLKLQLTDNVVTDRWLIEMLLYNMDSELSAILRRGTSLKNSGFHEDDLAKLAFVYKNGITNMVLTSPLDFEKFKYEAKDEWSRIDHRRKSNAEQIKLLSKRTTSLSVSSKNSSNTTSSTRPTSTQRTTYTPASTGRLSTLTDHEKDWLVANGGCFKCRKWNLPPGHSKDTCQFPAAPYVIKIPNGWKRGDPVPTSSLSNSSATTVGIRAIHEEEEDVDNQEEDYLGYSTDSDDSDGYAFPPLSLKVGSGRRGKLAYALADSGSSISVVSSDLVKELGLVKHKLSKPKRFKVAIQGNEKFEAITEFVRFPVRLANGTWSSRETTFLVAPLEPPFDIILGVPFMRQEKVSLTVSPEPQILVPNPLQGETLDLLAPAYGPLTRMELIENLDDESKGIFIASLINGMKEETEKDASEEEKMKELAKDLMEEFSDLFPTTLPALPEDYLDRTETRHRIKLVDPNKVHNQRAFSTPRKWKDAWKKLLEEHLAAGRLRPSTSPYASACFVIPKKDPSEPPRWLNDYRGINSNTVKDRTPLPLTDEILSEAALAKYWGKIDLTNAFFQSPVHPDDIEKTAIKTPWGLFEWTVMPQGLCNAPATHQARINEALRHLIGVCCAAFVDDIIIYSKTLEEHERNVKSVLQALRKANLYCSAKKTDLFTTRMEFLGHVISREGIGADESKVEKIKNWERPKTVTQVRGFLG
ncbi:hypothetical protein JCM3765_003078, partial [Sporobolomyces pararoseus]